MSRAYSTLKAGWHLDKIADLRAGRPVAPVSIQLILSDLCNNDCHWCAYRAGNGLSSEMFGENGNMNPNRMITVEKAEEIIQDAAAIGVKSITFTGGGEPTLHPHHMDLFKLALDLGLDCSLNTNGRILAEGWVDVLPRFTYIRFSVDAASPEEYAKIKACPVSAYDNVIQNLTNLVNECEIQDSDCVVGSGYVVTPDNWMNLKEGVSILRLTGAAYVRLAAMQSTKGKEAYDGEWGKAKAMTGSVAKQFDDDEFEVVDLMDSVLGEPYEITFCGMQHLVLYIGADLTTYRCCYTAYTPLGVAGSLRNYSLQDWLVDPTRIASYGEFDARQCLTCPLKEKSETIAYLAERDPLHVNFI